MVEVKQCAVRKKYCWLVAENSDEQGEVSGLPGLITPLPPTTRGELTADVERKAISP